MAPGDTQAGGHVPSPPTQPAGPAELGWSTQARRWTLPKIVFWSGLLVFVAARLTQAMVPALHRSEPAELDDSYRYLGQAQVMATCAGGGCPGLDAIEKQMSEGPTDAPTAFERLRTQIHLFTYFHPLYSLVLTGLRALGLGVPQAYNLASIAFGLMLCVAIGLWLGSVWGPAPAGIALGLLAFYQLPGQGFHFVPATFALGWAALSWALILKPRPGLYILLPILWIASLATHSIGLFYVAAALLMLLGMTRLPMDRRTRTVLGAGIVLILGRLAVALLWPSLGLSGDAVQFYGSATPWFEALRSGLAELADLVARWGSDLLALGSNGSPCGSGAGSLAQGRPAAGGSDRIRARGDPVHQSSLPSSGPRKHRDRADMAECRNLPCGGDRQDDLLLVDCAQGLDGPAPAGQSEPSADAHAWCAGSCLGRPDRQSPGDESAILGHFIPCGD